MSFFVQNLKLNGCKNIDKEININFYNNTLQEKMDLQNSSIKAIYGPNGAGKSGIMSALYIYKRLLCEKNSLNDSYFRNFVFENINKKTNLMSIKITFMNFDDSGVYQGTIKHEIVLSKSDYDVRIVEEKISELTGKRIKEDKFKDTIFIESGSIVNIINDDNNLIRNNSMNLLDNNSIVAAVDYLYTQEHTFNKWTTLLDLFVLKLFAIELTVELNKEDKHLDYFSNKQFVMSLFNKVQTLELLNKQITDKIELSAIYDDVVAVDKISEYEKMIDNLSSFIKIFKPDLKRIDIDMKINDKIYKCKKIFVYDNYSIDMEFESTGIKKLVRLYTDFKKYVNGGIVFIDEMDANLHDVYFTKLIEFFKYEAKGQLCFTTHNLEPIDVLKNNKYALEFLSNDSRIASWVKSGHQSPMNKYVNGLIPYSTFNVDSTNFEVLLEDSNE